LNVLGSSILIESTYFKILLDITFVGFFNFKDTGMPVEQMYTPNYFQHGYQQNQFNQKQKLNTTGFVNQYFTHGGPSSSNNHDQNLQQYIYHNNHRASIDGIYNIHGCFIY